MVDEILLNETLKVSTAREAPEFLGSSCDDNDLFQVERTSIEKKKNVLT